MGVYSPLYVGSTWPSNGGSYNWDAGLFSSWNAGLSSAFSRWGNAGRGSRASRLRRGLQAVCLSTEVVLRRRPWALRLGIAVVLRHGLRAPRLNFTWVALLASQLKHEFYYLMTYLQWILDSLQNPLQSFQNSTVDWDGFRNTLDFSSSSNALKTGLTIFRDILSLTLSGFWSS